jgi:hypothetical protein
MNEKSFVVYFSIKFDIHNQYLCLHVTSQQFVKLFVISYFAVLSNCLHIFTSVPSGVMFSTVTDE